jgi:CheY-like chemotaxis protein
MLRARTVASASGKRRALPKERSVLVVEDDAGQREVLVLALTAADMKVRTVSDGIEAFEALRNQDYRAILCDLRMPRQSGFTFYEQLEEMLPHLAARVVFLSAYAGDPEVRAYLERTGQPVIQKPYRIRQLVDAVNRTLEKPFHP